MEGIPDQVGYLMLIDDGTVLTVSTMIHLNSC